MSNVDKYRELTKALEYSFCGVKLSQVVSLKIWGAAKGNSVYSWRYLINLFRAYDVHSLKLPDNNGFLSTFMKEWRKDHYTLYNSVVERLSVIPTRNDLFSLQKCFSFHPLMCFKLASHLFVNLRFTGLSVIQKICWLSEYALLCNTILELENMDFSKVKKYLSMCHVVGLENLLTQYFRQKGIVTYSLEEGIYLVYKKSFVIGAIAYENFATDYLLCWGQYTKDEYVSYGLAPEKIRVAGYPKSNLLKPQRTNNDYKNCLVMLAGPVFGDVNNNLLELLNSLKDSIHITLKSHPSNFTTMERYAYENSINIIPNTQTISECMNSGEYDFSIAVNSTTYYESWISGVPCIRFNDDRFDNFYGFDDLFSTKEELESLLCEYRSNPKTVVEVRKMLEYAIGFGLDNYDTIIKE